MYVNCMTSAKIIKKGCLILFSDNLFWDYLLSGYLRSVSISEIER